MRLRDEAAQEASYWKEQCGRVEEEERALLERAKDLEARLRKIEGELGKSRAVEGELKRYEQLLLDVLSGDKDEGRRRDHSEATQGGEASGE